MSGELLLELCSCAGGAGFGYHQAGLDVVGVDIKPQPRYPFPFLRADAIEVLDMLLCGEVLPFSADGWHVTRRLGLEDFRAIHGSPPCQGYSMMSNCRPGLAGTYPRLIEPMRERMIRTGLPYVIENVEGAPLIDPVVLCGTMFGRELYRHRLFEANFPVVPPGHPEHVMPASRAGHWRPGTVMSVAGHFSPVSKGREIMGIGWTTRDELREAIPPCYTEYIGQQLNSRVREAA